MPVYIPSTRKVAVCLDTQHITVEERPIPTPRDSEVLLQIEAAGICATDLHLVRKSIPYLQRKVDICGHEGVGRIVAVGPEVDAAQWQIGDRVAHRWIYDVCLECEMCRGDNEQLCDSRKLSGKDVEGCWGEYTIVNTRYLMRIPEDMSAVEAAPTLCAGTTAYRALRTAGLAPGQWVAIVGAGGGLGHLAVQYARASGLRVLGIDTGSSKRELCGRLGATAYVDFMESQDLASDIIQLTDGGPHGVIVVSSSTKAYEQALTYVRKTGIIVCIGITPNKMNFPVGPEYFVARGIRLTGSSTGTMKHTQEALEYVRDGRVKPRIVETRLEEIEACLQALEKGEVEGRFVATFDRRHGRL
ncbi:zinc-dependent alcohol dehydrogenase [Aspergillus ibericus CBS 121593]|uniref:Alcohol dehydrogenase n=1 Tax=Aspergillus ibericus CBS 121593 TaxID=1448316 RepID=A0A395GLZ4_9EURO|nr:alcohol dehydrogenase [Aspergillus ibericus CBS 121593]RAK95847.1 alcohol dehydrogenase [Aspergillus ibericus CBS 121593]